MLNALLPSAGQGADQPNEVPRPKVVRNTYSAESLQLNFWDV